MTLDEAIIHTFLALRDSDLPIWRKVRLFPYLLVPSGWNDAVIIDPSQQDRH
jgi:hypothetical protein